MHNANLVRMNARRIRMDNTKATIRALAIGAAVAAWFLALIGLIYLDPMGRYVEHVIAQERSQQSR